MKNILSKWIAVLAVVGSQNVWAVPITDTVIVGSQEWAQVNLFTNVSWNAINAQCPSGTCTPTGSINGYGLDGWTWASIDTVQTLFNTFTGQATVAPGSYLGFFTTWAPEFLALFNPTTVNIDSEWVLGSTATPSDSVSAYTAVVANSTSTVGLQIGTAITFNVTEYQFASPEQGAWFVRDASPAPAPAPATLTLFGLGLASMWISRRKKYTAKV